MKIAFEITTGKNKEYGELIKLPQIDCSLVVLGFDLESRVKASLETYFLRAYYGEIGSRKYTSIAFSEHLSVGPGNIPAIRVEVPMLKPGTTIQIQAASSISDNVVLNGEIYLMLFEGAEEKVK